MITMIEQGVYHEEIDMDLLFAGMTDQEALKAVEKTIAFTGGAYAMDLSQEVKDRTLSLEYLTHEDRLKIETLSCGFYIHTYKQMLKDHTGEEKAALMQHELGHIRLGHLIVSAETQVARDGGKATVVDNIMFELAADATAAFHVSKTAMASALTKCLLAQADFISKIALARKGVVYPPQDLFERMMEEENIITRLKALR